MKDETNENIRTKLTRRFAQFREAPPPKGFASTCENLDVDLFEYDDTINGLVSTYLRHGLDSESIVHAKSIAIDRGQDLDRRFNECERKLYELRTHKNMVTELATLLAKCLDAET